MRAMIAAVSIRQESFRELPRPVADFRSTQSAAYMILHSGWIDILRLELCVVGVVSSIRIARFNYSGIMLI